MLAKKILGLLQLRGGFSVPGRDLHRCVEVLKANVERRDLSLQTVRRAPFLEDH
jgi:hypothetical protein